AGVAAARWVPRSDRDAATVPVASSSPAPPTGAPELVLRLCGSNTIGAALAPALGEAFLRLQGATGVVRSPATSGKSAVLTASGAGGATLQRMTIVSEGSATAFEGLADGSCDVGMSSRPIKPDEAARLRQKQLGEMRSAASEHVIALDGIAV